MAYRLIVTDSAEADLDSILAYLTGKLSNAEAAFNLSNRIEGCYDALEENPYLYSQCTHPILQLAGYRKAVVGSYLLIYHIDDGERLVYVDRFFSELQDYADKL